MGSLDAAGFDRLVHEHGSAILRLCRGVLRDEALAADAAQEAFLKLWRRHASAAPENPAGFLRKAALSSALDVARRRGVEARRRDPAASGEGACSESQPVLAAAGRTQAGGGDDDPQRLARLHELRERLDAAVALLPEAQRVVFVLRHESGMPLAEVAQTLGLSLPTVKTHFARAVLKLRHALSAFSPDREER